MADPNIFQQFLNKVGRGYGQVDKNVFGGLLPGGAASAVESTKEKINAATKNMVGAALNQLPDRVNLSCSLSYWSW
jgi:hypothetical protein